jgi:DNA-binding MarR family transcriptional regulator
MNQVKSIDLQATPGHLIRRAQQIAVSIFAEQLANADITPVQFAILNALLDSPGIDQVSLAKRVAFDPATSGSVIGRLEAKAWVERKADPNDRRRKLLVVTAAGVQAQRVFERSLIAALADAEGAYSVGYNLRALRLIGARCLRAISDRA